MGGKRGKESEKEGEWNGMGCGGEKGMGSGGEGGKKRDARKSQV